MRSNAVSFMRSYLTNRLQRCKINNSFGEWAKISAGVPQGSILCPLLFNIFIHYVFLFLQKYDLANHADDCTMYASDKRVCKIIDYLRHKFTILSNGFTITSWFPDYNPEKCSFMFKPTWYVVMIFFKTQNRKKC